mgnify:CR=1 FL=1
MDSNNLNVNEANLHAVDYWQVLKNRYGMIILTFILVMLTAAVITYVMPKMYESKVVVEIMPIENKSMNLGASNSSSQMGRNFFATQFSIIKSEETLKIASEDILLAKKWGIPERSSVRILKGIVNTQQERGTNLVRISVRHKDREDVEKIAEAVVKAYGKRRKANETRRLEDALEAFKRKEQEQEAKVEDHRKRLYELSRRLGKPYYGMNNQTARNDNMTESTFKKTTDRYETAKKDRDALEIIVGSLSGLDNDALLGRLITSGREEASSIRSDYTALDQVKGSVSVMIATGLGEAHPRVKATRVRAAEIQARLNTAVIRVRDKLGSDLITMNKRVEKLKADAEEDDTDRTLTAQEETQFGEVRDEYEKEMRILETIKNASLQERISEGLLWEPLRYHEMPATPEQGAYVSPNWVLNMALGAVAGLIFGVGIAFALELMDTSVKSLEDVEKYLQVPVLAVVPRDVGVLHKQAGASPDAEAYRILRTNIEFNRKNPDDNAITVVSGGAGEGKSTTLVNLAYICAQGGYSTLMIDADLRRPRLHTFFDINNTVGLTNYLTTDLMLEDVILQTPVDNLFFMPSGILPADAAGILNSRRMSEMVQDVKQRFDLVLIDSPPILGVSDASVLASEVDLTMIVVQHRKLPRNMLMRVKQAVENVGGTVLGVVLNNVDVRSDSQYQYYTSYYTYYAPSELDRDKTSSNAVEPASTNKSAARPDVDSDDLY